MNMGEFVIVMATLSLPAVLLMGFCIGKNDSEDSDTLSYDQIPWSERFNNSAK